MATQKQTASLKGGLTHGMSIHPYDGTETPDANGSGTSIFDPTLCELLVRWFAPPDGLVLDPFAGGSVRGIVSAKLGRRYLGIELRAEQIAANREQAETICEVPLPEWVEGDSRDVLPALPEDVQADFILSCPPYGDLECYSEDARDLSTLTLDEFREAYAEVVCKACARLKDHRFAAFVVGDYRDKDGLLVGFPSRTILAFEAAGLRLYNEAVLVTAAGSLPIRVGKMFTSSRKLGKTHQNVLVFVKGDPRLATEAIGAIEMGELAESETDEDTLGDGSDLEPEAEDVAVPD